MSTPQTAATAAPDAADGNISGIVVISDPVRIDDVLAALATLPGVELHGCDRATGRIALTQEAADVGAEVQAYGRIRALPGVLGADLTCHYFGDGHADAEGVAPDAGSTAAPTEHPHKS